MSPAEKLLVEARAESPMRPVGCARSGLARVSWYRAARHRQYEVGTDALSVAVGLRKQVLPYVEALLAGCVTRDECKGWIAARDAAGAST